MWRKPAEITRGRYRDDRFEIAVQLDDYASGQQMTPAMALESWLRSSAHRAVLANRGPWSHEAWQAMGVAVSQHYAVAWFGRSPDDGKARSRASQPASSSSPATRSARTQVTIRDASGRAFRTTAGE